MLDPVLALQNILYVIQYTLQQLVKSSDELLLISLKAPSKEILLKSSDLRLQCLDPNY
jgi:hypothetical protein